jgi:hypothetical protein
MIPSDDEVLGAWIPFLARRYELDPPAPSAVTAALEEARTLAADGRDEAAALFFALSHRARALRGWWSILPQVAALRLAPGFRATAAELRALRLDVASRRANFEDVRRRFAEHAGA